MITRENDRHQELELQLGSLRYRGISIGSHGTCHQFPDLKLMFDVGVASLSSTTIPNVLITHVHQDHVGALWEHHHRRKEWGLPTAHYFVDSCCRADLYRVLQAWADLQGETAPYICSGDAADSILFSVKRKLKVVPFYSCHRITCLGYSIQEERRRLKEEYRSCSQKSLVLARASGLEVSESYDANLLAFPGDTSIFVYDKTRPRSLLQSAEVLLLECSFIDEQVQASEARVTGHVHLDDFVQAAKEGHFDRNKHILLTHFSARYTTAQIRRIVESRLRDELPAELVSKIQLLVP